MADISSKLGPVYSLNSAGSDIQPTKQAGSIPAPALAPAPRKKKKTQKTDGFIPISNSLAFVAEFKDPI